MKCLVESIFDCPADRVWRTLQTSALMCHVMRPLIRVAPVADATLPAQWREGMEVRCRLYLLGAIPLGTRPLLFERVDPNARAIQTRERDRLVRRWDHRIRVEATADGRTRYADHIDIDASWLTLPVWLIAHRFYRHRQHRWRAIAGDLCPRITHRAQPQKQGRACKRLAAHDSATLADRAIAPVPEWRWRLGRRLD